MATAVKTKWVYDPAHTEISFKVKHLMIVNVKGLFKEFDMNVTTNGDNFTGAQIDFKMKAASIDTGDAGRDGHLKSVDFFDVENHPEITFRAISFKSTGNDNFELVGDLTIRGVTKPVKLDAEFGGMQKDPWGNTKAGFSLTGKINRKDFGLHWNAALESGGVLVGDEVKILCEVELAKQG
ncbi:MAG: polyisoprenoid-binding protein [Porphyromonadaceae bacterium]|nr:MAG: polyisoprenoid-binding protein [Porphyromonadaceae bacterium]